MVRVHVDGEYGCGGIVEETIIIAYRDVEYIILLRVTNRPAKIGHFFCVDAQKQGFEDQNSHRPRKIMQFFRDDDAKCLPYPEYDSSTAFTVYGFRSSINTSALSAVP